MSRSPAPPTTSTNEDFDHAFRWGTRIRAIAQTGLAYATDPYDRERYTELLSMATECLSKLTSRPVSTLTQIFAEETGYPTPKSEVRAVVFQEGRVLLVRERREGVWSLPGGFADLGFTPAEIAAKEAFEESGYLVRPRKVLAIFDRAKHPHPPSIHHVYRIFFLCDLVGGEPTLSVETDAVGFFARDELPPLCPSRLSAAQLARMFYHHDHPDAPADFD